MNAIVPVFVYNSPDEVTVATSLVTTNTDSNRTVFIDDTSAPTTTDAKLYVYLYEDTAWASWNASINAADHTRTENELTY